MKKNDFLQISERDLYADGYECGENKSERQHPQKCNCEIN